MAEFSPPKKSCNDGSPDGIKYGRQSLRSLPAGEIIVEMFFKVAVIRLINMTFSTATNITSITRVGFSKPIFRSVAPSFSTSFALVNFTPMWLPRSSPSMEDQLRLALSCPSATPVAKASFILLRMGLIRAPSAVRSMQPRVCTLLHWLLPSLVGARVASSIMANGARSTKPGLDSNSIFA